MSPLSGGVAPRRTQGVLWQARLLWQGQPVPEKCANVLSRADRLRGGGRQIAGLQNRRSVRRRIREGCAQAEGAL